MGRLSEEELMDQLSSFLPAVFEAFGNQSADVRKVNKSKSKSFQKLLTFLLIPVFFFVISLEPLD